MDECRCKKHFIWKCKPHATLTPLLSLHWHVAGGPFFHTLLRTERLVSYKCAMSPFDLTFSEFCQEQETFIWHRGFIGTCSRCFQPSVGGRGNTFWFFRKLRSKVELKHSVSATPTPHGLPHTPNNNSSESQIEAAPHLSPKNFRSVSMLPRPSHGLAIMILTGLEEGYTSACTSVPYGWNSRWFQVQDG